MALRETQLNKPPFFQKMALVRIFHISALAITYALAAAFFPGISFGLHTHAYFSETYLGGLGASVALSVIALFLRPGMPLYLILCLRCYVLVILGYSIEGILSSKLVLGLGLMLEMGILVDFPLNLGFEAAALAVLAVTQAWPVFFGPSGLAEASSPPSPDQLAVFCLVLAAFALMASWIARMAARQRELGGIIRIQEANLDTLTELNLNLQGYARTVDEESSERERNRISREIHDISGYIFTNLIALMDAAGSMRRDDQAGLTDILVTARTQAQEGLRETRVALHKLRDERPRTTDSTQAVFKIVSIFRKITGIAVELNLGNLPHFLSQDLNLALYRTVQEALTNAVRHGKASQVRVNFWVDGEEIRLTITDNGKGALEVVKGIGITGMEERIGALGGSVGVGRAPEGGFSLTVLVPLKAAAPGG
jgi:signal transduction histidine kinase